MSYVYVCMCHDDMYVCVKCIYTHYHGFEVQLPCPVCVHVCMYVCIVYYHGFEVELTCPAYMYVCMYVCMYVHTLS